MKYRIDNITKLWRKSTFFQLIHQLLRGGGKHKNSKRKEHVQNITSDSDCKQNSFSVKSNYPYGKHNGSVIMIKQTLDQKNHKNQSKGKQHQRHCFPKNPATGKDT